METLLVVVAVVEIVVAVVLVQRWRAQRAPASSTSAPSTSAASTSAPRVDSSRGRAQRPRVRLPGDPLRLALDLDVADPTSPFVTRLADEAAVNALTADATVQEVIVTDRGGVVLAHLHRPEPPARKPAPAPEAVRAEPRGRTHTPRVVPSSSTAHPTISRDIDPEDLHVEAKPLAERFHLPAPVREGLARKDDPVELLRAILEAAGLRPEVSGTLIRCGDRLVEVVGGDGSFGSHEALNRAFLQFQDSGATSGLVVAFTDLDPADVRRRELLAPQLKYVGSVNVQRMADAVAVGADPLAFASGPVVMRR